MWQIEDWEMDVSVKYAQDSLDRDAFPLDVANWKKTSWFVRQKRRLHLGSIFAFFHRDLGGENPIAMLGRLLRDEWSPKIELFTFDHARWVALGVLKSASNPFRSHFFCGKGTLDLSCINWWKGFRRCLAQVSTVEGCRSFKLRFPDQRYGPILELQKRSESISAECNFYSKECWKISDSHNHLHGQKELKPKRKVVAEILPFHH